MIQFNTERNIILAARLMSMVFTPFYLPLVGLMALFMFSYLGLMPWAYKLQVLTLVYVFTILLPTILIHIYRKYKGWNLAGDQIVPDVEMDQGALRLGAPVMFGGDGDRSHAVGFNALCHGRA